jgi:hypothetical protein
MQHSNMDRRVAEIETRVKQIVHRDLNLSYSAYESQLREFSNLRAPDPELEDSLSLAEEHTTSTFFKEARTWDDIRALYIAFAKGVLPSVPTHSGPLLLDSQAQIAQLEKIIKLGIITTDSQPGVCNNQERQRA